MTLIYGNEPGNISLIPKFIDFCLDSSGTRKLISKLQGFKALGKKKYAKQNWEDELAVFKARYKDVEEDRDFVPLGIGLVKR